MRRTLSGTGCASSTDAPHSRAVVVVVFVVVVVVIVAVDWRMFSCHGQRRIVAVAVASVATDRAVRVPVNLTPVVSPIHGRVLFTLTPIARSGKPITA